MSGRQAVLYRRVSTREQGESGLGLGAQLATLEREAEHRGWTIVGDHHDVASGRRTNGRHGLEAALAMLRSGEADILAVAKLDRLARSTVHFGQLLKTASRQGWAVVALDVGVDTTTSNGRLVAKILMDVAEWEAERIGDRTSEALAEKKAGGAQLGRPSPLPAATRQKILRLHRRGLGARRIAKLLNEQGTPTASGTGRWHVTTVQRVLARRKPSA